MFQHETMLARLVAGEKLDAQSLLSLTQAIEELAPTPPPIPKVQLTIVHSADIRCPACAHRFNPHNNRTIEPEPEATPRHTLDLRAEAVTTAEVSAEAPARKAVAALPAPADSGSSFHQPLPNGERAPLAKEQPRIDARYFDPNGGGPLVW